MKEIVTAIVTLIAVCAISIAVAAGIIKLICLCFGLAFVWRYVLGIWLLMLLIRMFLVSGKND